ncbi:MAG: hypothetical protein V3V33_14665 [Candidatus Lokiarchaeia archaeon]
MKIKSQTLIKISQDLIKNENGFYSIFKKFITIFRDRIKRSILTVGLYDVIQTFMKFILNYNTLQKFLNNFNDYWTWYYLKFKSSRSFRFNNKKYNYFYHKYNITWNNERAIELPIIWKIVKKYENKNILEVGNVLSHFFDFQHDIVDKYEIADGVINQDIVDYNPLNKYDLIVTISTLEHVGWDETPREPLKILRAIENLKSLINENGKIIITLPKGHSPMLDNLLKENRIKFSEQYFFKRISRSNKWKQVNWNKISKAVYGYPIRYSANGIIVGFIY